MAAYNQNHLGVEIIFKTDYKDAKEHAAAIDELARKQTGAKYPDAPISFWCPIKETYDTVGKLMTQIKREIRRNRAGYRKGQVFFIYEGKMGLGTTEHPFVRYFGCIANGNTNGTEPLDPQ